MKKRLKRIVCFLTAATIMVTATFPAHAAAVPVSLSPSSYVLSLLLNSMGLDVGLSALSSWVGSTETYQDYVAAGEKGTLSAWEQWCYDQSKAEGGQALKDSYEANIEWLGKLSWGDTVETIPTEKLHSSAKSLNDWARTFPSYGTDETLYKRSTSAPARPPCDPFPDDMIISWILDQTKIDSTRGKYDQYDVYYISSSYTEYGKDYSTGYTSSSSYDGIVGYRYSSYADLYDINTGKKIEKFRRSSFRYWYLTNSYETSSPSTISTQVTYDVVKDLPIPIFDSKDEMYAYTSGKQVDAVNGKDKSGLKAKAVNPSLQKTMVAKPRIIALPADEDTAKKNLDAVNMGADVDTIIKALEAAGLTIDKGIDVPDESETTDETTADDTDKKVITSLGQIIEKLEAIPKAIGNFFMIDTDAIDAAFKELHSTFLSKFELLSKLVNIFKDSGRSFSESPPIIKMQTPDCLKFAIHDDYMMVMDLTAYANYFVWVRGIIAAAIWVSFGKWLLDQFNVQFHIG